MKKIFNLILLSSISFTLYAGDKGNGGNYRTLEFSESVDSIFSKLQEINRTIKGRRIIRGQLPRKKFKSILKKYYHEFDQVKISFVCDKLVDDATNSPKVCINKPEEKLIVCNEKEWIKQYKDKSPKYVAKQVLHEVLDLF